MRVTILTVGSRGDVQPLVALGAGLRDAGHEVRLATHPRFTPLAAHHGLEVAPLAEGDVSRGAQTDAGRRWIESGSRRLPTAVGLLRDARSVARQRLRDALQAADGADVVVAANLAIVLGWQVSDLLGVPLVRAFIGPPLWMMRRRSARRLALLARQAGWLVARPWLNSVRRDALGAGPVGWREPLAALDRCREPALLAFSAAVLPPPAGLADPYEVTGYWFLRGTDDPEPPEELLAFVDAGTPPVAVGFGSMIETDGPATVRLVAEALRRADRRGVLFGRAAREAGARLPAHLFAIESIDHEWLFAHCAAAVHHASAGTTAAAVRAGLPSVSIPHMSDQFTWARRLDELGVSPPPIRHRDLTAGALATAIRRATGDTEMRRRAAALGECVQGEDGAARAVAALERRLGVSRPTPTFSNHPVP